MKDSKYPYIAGIAMPRGTPYYNISEAEILIDELMNDPDDKWYYEIQKSQFNEHYCFIRKLDSEGFFVGYLE